MCTTGDMRNLLIMVETIKKRYTEIGPIQPELKGRRRMKMLEVEVMHSRGPSL